MKNHFISSPDELNIYFSFHSTAGKNQNFSSSISNQPFFFSTANETDPDLLSIPAGGKITYSSPATYHAEPLPAYLLILVTEGEGNIHFASTDLSLSRDSVLFLPKQQAFHFSTTKTPFSYQLYLLCGSCLSAYQYRLAETDSFFFSTELLQPDYVRTAMQQIDYLLEHQSRDFIFLIARLLTDILTELVVLSAKEEVQSSSLPAHVQKMKLIFDHDYQNNHSLDDLEAEIGIGKYRLCHDFSKHMKISPLQYLNLKRIEKAKELLVQTETTVHAIGAQVGIPNTNHFIRLFQKNTGVTPLQYRQNRQINR